MRFTAPQTILAGFLVITLLRGAVVGVQKVKSSEILKECYPSFALIQEQLTVANVIRSYGETYLEHPGWYDYTAIEQFDVQLQLLKAKQDSLLAVMKTTGEVLPGSSISDSIITACYDMKSAVRDGVGKMADSATITKRILDSKVRITALALSAEKQFEKPLYACRTQFLSSGEKDMIAMLAITPKLAETIAATPSVRLPYNESLRMEQARREQERLYGAEKSADYEYYQPGRAGNVSFRDDNGNLYESYENDTDTVKNSGLY